MRTFALLAPLSLLIAGCGGGAAEAPTPAAPPQTQAPAPEYEPASPVRDSIWHVYWDGIHCLTIYPTAGAIRSEEPNNANATFSSRSEHFSIVSVYWEREDAWAPAIDAAADLDDLLSRLRRMEAVDVEEVPNPLRDYSY
jgi:hypothetical protein